MSYRLIPGEPQETGNHLQRRRRHLFFTISLIAAVTLVYLLATFNFVEFDLTPFLKAWRDEETETIPFDDSDPDESKNDDDLGDDNEYLLKLASTDSNGTFSLAGFNAAPRTTRIPYNDLQPDRRYFLYSPSGGLSNQLIEIAYALEIGRVLNRTVLIPMIGRHSSGWMAYQSLTYEELFPADRILDFGRLVQKTPCVPLNMSVEDFARSYVKLNGASRIRIVYHPHRVGWTKQDLMRAVGTEKRKLLYLRGAEMYHHWFTPETTLKLKKFIRFSVHLRRRAVEIVNRMFPTREFNAMHVRLSDYSARWGTFQERSNAILAKALTERFGPKRQKFDKKVPIYLASDEPMNGGFVELKKQFKVIVSSQLPKELVDDYKELFPQSRIRHDMTGVLEQLICAQAIYFSGTSWSTFSEHIELIRDSKAKLFPELLRFDATAPVSFASYFMKIHED